MLVVSEAWVAPVGSFLQSFKHGKNTTYLMQHLLVVAMDKKESSWVTLGLWCHSEWNNIEVNTILNTKLDILPSFSVGAGPCQEFTHNYVALEDDREETNKPVIDGTVALFPRTCSALPKQFKQRVCRYTRTVESPQSQSVHLISGWLWY